MFEELPSRILSDLLPFVAVSLRCKFSVLVASSIVQEGENVAMRLHLTICSLALNNDSFRASLAIYSNITILILIEQYLRFQT